MTVALRLALRGLDDAGGAAFATVIPALAVALVAAAFHPNLHGAWPFLLAGLLAPGGSQILFTLAVRETGASRTSVMVGAAPLVAVAIALVFLDEPLRLPLLVGAVGIVAGGVLLAAERDRPGHIRRLGLAVRGRRCGALRDPRQPRTRPAHAHVARHGGRGDAGRRHDRRGGLDAPGADRARAASARPGRRALRSLVRLPVRGVLPRTRQRRLAARRDRVAVGRRACRRC